MTGIGVSHGAISVLNAIPNGIGSTIGIALKTEAAFKESDKTIVTIIDRQGMSTSLAERCVQRTFEKIGKEPFPYELTITSEIPPSRGLKSSSSVCNAVILSVLDHFKIKMDDLEIIRLGVQCAKECGVTVTGAFDDACGCYMGGLVITNNTKCELLAHKPMEKYDVVICIPEREIPKNKVDASVYRARKEFFDSLARNIEKDPLSVLRQNGEAVADIMKIDDSLAKDAIKAGALSAGVSGTGPAIAVVCRKDDGKRIANELGSKTIITETI